MRNPLREWKWTSLLLINTIFFLIFIKKFLLMKTYIDNIIHQIRGSKTAFSIGIILLVINPPMGWLGFIIAAYLTARFGRSIYFLWAMVLYGITWGMSGIGIILAGPRGFHLSKITLKNIWRKLFVRRRYKNSKQ